MLKKLVMIIICLLFIEANGICWKKYSEYRSKLLAKHPLSSNLIPQYLISSSRLIADGQGFDYVDKNTFIDYSYIAHVYLRNNNFTMVKSGTFDPLVNLTVLALDNNKFKRIEDMSINRLLSLIYLSITNNLISTFRYSLLDYSTNLQQIFLDSNPITSLDFSSTKTVNNLRTLSLSNASIEKLEYAWNLQNASLLEYLDLSVNRIQIIPNGYFSFYKNLSALYINENKIDKLDSNVFQGLAKIKLINLSNNMLNTTFKTKSFYNLTGLPTGLIIVF